MEYPPTQIYHTIQLQMLNVNRLCKKSSLKSLLRVTHTTLQDIVLLFRKSLKSCVKVFPHKFILIVFLAIKNKEINHLKQKQETQKETTESFFHIKSGQMYILLLVVSAGVMSNVATHFFVP